MDNPVIAAVRPKLGPPQRAWACGTLHAIPERNGWYPAMVAGQQRVEGTLHEVTAAFTSADLDLLDRYEAYDPAHPAACEYVRAQVDIEAESGWRGQAEVYVYACSLPADSRPIAEPSFASFLAAHGFSALAPRD